MNEKEIEKEAYLETTKDTNELIKDSIREANTVPKYFAGEKENLDIIKHLLKRLAVHQIVLQKRANDTNNLLIMLSIIMAVGAIFSILIYFK